MIDTNDNTNDSIRKEGLTASHIGLDCESLKGYQDYIYLHN